MKIALHDSEKEYLKRKSFPNYALMKISAYHKSVGDTVEWWQPEKKYDRVYSSKIFDFTPENPLLPPDTVKGGTGYDIHSVLSAEIEEMFPDYSIYPDCDYAIGYITRGCPNHCRWCIVPEKEGDIKPYRTWEKLVSLILSSKHGKGLVIGAKLFVAFVISAVLIILLTIISYAETMAVWGSGGAGGSLLMLGNIFPYNVTIGQSALLYSVCMLAACLLVTAITSLLSALFKTPFSTVVIMAIFLIAPMFIVLPDSSPIWAFLLENLLPTNMMAFWGAMYEFQYDIFGLMIPPYVFIPVFAAAVSCLCSYLAYRGFRKHQIN